RLPQERDHSRFRRGPPQLDDRYLEPRAGQPVQSGESEVLAPDEAAILVRSAGHPPGRKAPQSSSVAAERWKRVEHRDRVTPWHCSKRSGRTSDASSSSWEVDG